MAEKICVISPKGGVGKTTVALNLGLHLAENLNKKTLVVDSNLHAANLSFYLGLPNLPVTLNDVIKWNLPIEKAIYAYSQNFHFVPATIRFEKNVDLINTKKFKEVMAKVNPYYDYVIFDSPPGVGKDIKSLLSNCDKVVLVTTPDLPTVATCIKGSFLAKKLGKYLSVVVNKVTGYMHELSLEEIKEMLKPDEIHELPYDFRVKEAVARREPAFHDKKARAAKKLEHLAKSIAGMIEEEIKEEEQFLIKLFNKVKEKLNLK